MKDLLIRLYQLTQEEMDQIQEQIASLPATEANHLKVQTRTLHTMAKLGELRANNPGVPLDSSGRLIRCSCCHTTKNLHEDFGCGGPYRCNSPDCVMF